MACCRNAPAAGSPQLCFDERNFEHLGMLNRPVSEVSVFAKQLPVIRCDRDVCVLRDDVEKLVDDGVEVRDGANLTLAQPLELAVVEHLLFFRQELSAYHLLVEMLEHT